ncbi:uncharacterized protein H6S33_004643 [Morchella sextelata]|uniref:uncharacterized protein n=1 Tax=Morchella sextelata TaxID=1174677 RepID=UPI001D03F603|nr:uncharacterized protein H6S33_004643 [Morchella sextelata]KAH0605421.1 hypothetical protein H6S33_004643 [Morchella sextelata]
MENQTRPDRRGPSGGRPPRKPIQVLGDLLLMRREMPAIPENNTRLLFALGMDSQRLSIDRQLGQRFHREWANEKRLAEQSVRTPRLAYESFLAQKGF